MMSLFITYTVCMYQGDDRSHFQTTGVARFREADKTDLCPLSQRNSRYLFNVSARLLTEQNYTAHLIIDCLEMSHVAEVV